MGDRPWKVWSPSLYAGTLSRVQTVGQVDSSIRIADDTSTRDTHAPARIGILIVAYNALTTVISVLKRIPSDVWEEIEEVAIFDDASGDETYEVAVGYKKLTGLDKLKIFRNHENKGYGGNQKLGYQYFMDKGFDVVVLLHGDGQYAPEMLAEMYRPILNREADAVFGSRMLKDYGGPLKGGMPLYKFVGNKILTGLANRALGMRLSEFHSGYRAYSLKALRNIDVSAMTDDFHFDTQIIIKLNHQGYQIKEVPIPTYYGSEICHVNGIKYAKDVALSLHRYRRTAQGIACYPEYAEYFVHYPLKDSGYSSHDYFQKLVGVHQRVLDVGCGQGFFAARIATADNDVTGIDILDKPACSHSLAEYHQLNLDHGLSQLEEVLKAHGYDRILLQDILEHLNNPGQLLEDCRPLLSDNGRLLVSVPNIANITVRLSLLLGYFEYTERGILDKTHVRFFTRSSITRLLENSGYQVVETKMTVIPIELVCGLPASHPLMRFCISLLAWATWLMPTLLGYQTILIAKPKQAASTEIHRIEAVRKRSA